MIGIDIIYMFTLSKRFKANLIRHPLRSDFGHDKSICIKPYAKHPRGQRPHLFYCGDGVSDLSAARETDLLFAKEGMDLITYCQKEKIPYTEFRDFKLVLSKSKITIVSMNA